VPLLLPVLSGWLLKELLLLWNGKAQAILLLLPSALPYTIHNSSSCNCYESGCMYCPPVTAFQFCAVGLHGAAVLNELHAHTRSGHNQNSRTLDHATRVDLLPLLLLLPELPHHTPGTTAAAAMSPPPCHLPSPTTAHLVVLDQVFTYQATRKAGRTPHRDLHRPLTQLLCCHRG
jgi:hypothetical protein